MVGSESIKNIASALCRAQAEYQPIKRNADNPFFRSRYADLAQVCEHLMPILNKHGIAVVQPTDIVDGQDVVITTLMHGESGEWIMGRYAVRPVKADPQSMGSAVTYARRYGLCAISGIAVEGEDDDGAAGSGTDKKSGRGAPPVKTSQGKKGPPTPEPIEDPQHPAPVPPAKDNTPASITGAQLKTMFTMLTNKGYGKGALKDWLGEQGLTVASSKDIPASWANKIFAWIDTLESKGAGV